MITLLTSLVAVYVIWFLYRRLRNAAITPQATTGLYVSIALFFILALSGSFFPEDNAEGRGTSTVVLFIAVPLSYLFLTRNYVRKILRPLARHGYIGICLSIFLLTYPLDLTVGFDAGSDLLEHMLSVLGFYIGISIILAYIFRRYQLGAKRVFIIGGLLGVLIEQNFLGPLLLFTQPIGFLVFAPMIFLTYALYLLCPYLLLNEELCRENQKPITRSLLILIFIMISVFPLLIWLVTNELLVRVGIVS